MAVIVIITGSLLGFFGAIAGWLIFDLSFLAGLAIWIGSGPASALIAVTLAGIQPAREPQTAEPALAEI